MITNKKKILCGNKTMNIQMKINSQMKKNCMHKKKKKKMKLTHNHYQLKWSRKHNKVSNVIRVLSTPIMYTITQMYNNNNISSIINKVYIPKRSITNTPPTLLIITIITNVKNGWLTSWMPYLLQSINRK